MTSPISYTIDDKDLDDATLWAVIDSAEASLSVSKPRSKPLALKYSNSRSPATPISNFSSHSPPQNHRFHTRSSPYSDYGRPSKISRIRASDVSECTSPLAFVRTAPYLSPEAYLSPQIGKVVNGEGSEVTYGRYRDGELKDVANHCLNGMFPSVSLFKEYQNAAMAILEKSDYTMISGNPFIKKSGWRKISCYFNISYEIKDKTIEFDDNRNVQRAEFIVRAHMKGGRFSDGWGSCERREKRFMKPNHDIPSTAETRAKNKACQDLLGIGEYRPGASQFHQKM